MGKWQYRPVADNFPTQEAIKLYSQGYSLKKVSRMFSQTYSTTRRILIENGIEIRRPVTFEDLDWGKIVNSYNDGLSVMAISRNLGCSDTVIRNGFKKLGIRIRSANEQISLECKRGEGHVIVDEEFFDTWTHKMAYLLGWIISDGNIPDTLRCVRITSVDIDHLDKLANLIAPGSNISIRKFKKKSWNDAGTLSINRVKVVSSLLEMGIKPNKSLTIKMPKIPPKYFGDFLRGVFEGDGCITFKKGQPKVVFVSGSESFIVSLRDILNSVLSLSGNVAVDRKGTWVLNYYSKNNCKKIYEFMYLNVPFSMILERKYYKFADYYGGVAHADQHKRKDSERENINEKVSYLRKAGKPN